MQMRRKVVLSIILYISKNVIWYKFKNYWSLAAEVLKFGQLIILLLKKSGFCVELNIIRLLGKIKILLGQLVFELVK